MFAWISYVFCSICSDLNQKCLDELNRFSASFTRMKGKAHVILSEKKPKDTMTNSESQNEESDYQLVDEAEITPLPDSEDEYVCVYESQGELVEKVVTYC